MELIPTIVEQYAETYTSREHPLLAELIAHTMQAHPEAHMISGHVQGQLLMQLSRMIRPRRILEIGTFVGYSALCLAEGLTGDGMLHTIEKREADAKTAEGYFLRSSFKDQIKLHVGDALAVMEALKENWDLVFIDADKVNYIAYYEAVVTGMRAGSWILADNIFFHGQVLESEVKGKNAQAMAAFSQHVARDPRTEQVILTQRDGLMLIRKI